MGMPPFPQSSLTQKSPILQKSGLNTIWKTEPLTSGLLLPACTRQMSTHQPTRPKSDMDAGLSCRVDEAQGGWEARLPVLISRREPGPQTWRSPYFSSADSSFHGRLRAFQEAILGAGLRSASDSLITPTRVRGRREAGVTQRHQGSPY